MNLNDLLVHPLVLLQVVRLGIRSRVCHEIERHKEGPARQRAFAALDFFDAVQVAREAFFHTVGKDLASGEGPGIAEGERILRQLEADFDADPLHTSNANAYRLDSFWQDVAVKRTNLAWAKYMYFRSLIDALGVYKRSVHVLAADQEASHHTNVGVVN